VKKKKTEKLKSKNGYKQSGVSVESVRKKKRKAAWEGFAEKEGLSLK